MKYDVALPDDVAAKIELWGLSKQSHEAILQAISIALQDDDLSKFGRRIRAPIRCVIVWTYVVLETGDFRITTWVNDHESADVRIVLDVALTKIVT